jgi:thiol-disulfide isomerase/thioredoxin
MRKFIVLSILLLAFYDLSWGQKGYEIKVNFKGNTDSTFYLARYSFGQSYIIDSCKRVKNGVGVFKGKQPLDRGVYILANQSRERYFDFLINDNQKFSMKAEFPKMINTLRSPDSKENDDLFAYARFFTNKNEETQKIVAESKGKSKVDSIKFIKDFQVKTNDEIKKFDEEFMAKHKGTFAYDFLNLKNEKVPTNVPLAKNGRPDSVYQYYYYKNHYFEGVNFKDDRIIYTPFFADRIKRYFDVVIVQQPDTIIKELDKVFEKCTEGSLVYNTLLGHFTYKYETDKTMTYDKNGKTNTLEKVFVHLADKYITSGRAAGLYSDETVTKIKNRINIVRNLLPGARVADLYMIDTINARQVLKMGFDTAKTTPGATEIYSRNANKLLPLYTTLYAVKAKYTLLVFWSVDCGHCQAEIPKLNESLKQLKGKVDFKVYAVQTKEEFFDRWRKFIIDKKLDFINVFEPVHINNLTDRFDINRTPVIYLLDREKKIIVKNMSSEQAVEIIKNLESDENITN